MNKLILLVLLIFSFTSIKSQDCSGVSCIANPNIEQQEKIFCYEEQPDSMQNNYCESDDCIKVCELTSFNYTTPYNIGSSFIWSVIGGQLTSTSPSGNSITILWDSVGSGIVNVIEQDTNMCSKNSMICIDIIPKPIAAILTLANSDTICQGSSTQFQAIDINNSMFTQLQDDCDSNSYMTQGIDSAQFIYELQYLWSFDDGSTSTDKNPVHVFNNPGLHTVSLSISNPCQCYDVVTMDVLVINTPGPSITSCVGTLCEGDTAEYCTDAVLPNWTIIGGTIFNSSFTNNCIAVIWDNTNNELDDGGGEILVGDLNSSCGQSQSFYSVPVVPSNPIIKGNIIACPATFENYSFECIPGMDYYWSISGGWGATILSGNNTSEILVSFDQWAANTSYLLTLNMSSSTLGCIPASVTINVDVLQSINGISVSTNVCEDASVNYYDWNGSQYNWTVINGSIISSLPNSQIDVIWDEGPGNGMIIVEPINSGIYCQNSKSYPINISETPTSATNILGDSLICPGSTYVYSVEESNATSSLNLSYNWNVIGGIASITNGEVCNITWDLVGPYSIEITNALLSYPNCSSPVLTKIINTIPNVNPVISGSSIACFNSVSTFNLTSVYPVWAVITWSLSNSILGSVISEQGSSQVEIEWGSQPGSTDVVIDVEVCGVIYSESFPITFLNQSISFTPSINPVCSETMIAFTSTAGAGDYQWNFGDNTSSAVSNPNKIYDDPGKYLVQLTFTDAANQCISTYKSIIDIQGIAGNLFPEGTSLFCQSNTINQQLYISTLASYNGSVEWFHNGNYVSSSNSYIINSTPPTQNGVGIYTAEVTDLNGCINTLNPINITTYNCGGGGGGGGGCPNLVPLVSYPSCNPDLGTMSFNFISPNGSAVDWRVDNGSIVSNPITFDKAGVFKVKAYSGACLLGAELITVPVIVDFDNYAICDPLNGSQITYYFNDNSSYLLDFGIATYLWDFGDGNTSILQNPNHVYAVNGNYNVNLTLTYGTYTCNKLMNLDVTDFDVSYTYSGLKCESTPTITFTSISSPTNIASWSWVFGDGSTSEREIPNRTYNSSSTYISNLQVTDIYGCQSAETLPIIIEQNPNIILISNFGPMCSNDNSVDLTNIVTHTNFNLEVSTWSGNGIDYDPITQIYYFNPLLAGGGTHEICVTITDNNGCYDKEYIMIDVFCPEKPRIFGNSEYCYDNSNSWNNYVYLNTQNNYISYQWFKNAIPTSSPSSSIWDNINTWGTYDYIVEVVDNNGCTIISEPHTINMNNSPNNVYIYANSNVCPGEDIILTHNGSQLNEDYYWNTLPQQQSTNITTTALADYEYTVTAINEFGCESVSNSVIVPSEIHMCGLLSGCLCDSEIINNQGDINISGLSNSWQYFSYEWMLNGNSFPNAQLNTNLIIDPNNSNYLTICSGEITLEVTDNNACTSISNPLSIEPNCTNCYSSNLNQNISESICVGDSIIFGSNTYFNPGVYINNLQSINGCDSNIIMSLSVTPLQTNLQNIIICNADSVIIGANTYYNNGVYTDTFNLVTGCDSVVITELVLSNPIANLSIISSSLSAYASGGIAPYYFEIGNQNGMLLNPTTFNNPLSYNPITNGLYYFFIIDANNCVSDTVFYQLNNLPNLNLDYQINDLFIYPNPSSGTVNISFESLISQNLEFSLSNILGEEIITNILNDFKGNYIQKIDLSTNSKGVYFIKIKSDKEIINHKLILQ